MAFWITTLTFPRSIQIRRPKEWKGVLILLLNGSVRPMFLNEMCIFQSLYLQNDVFYRRFDYFKAVIPCGTLDIVSTIRKMLYTYKIFLCFCFRTLRKLANFEMMPFYCC